MSASLWAFVADSTAFLWTRGALLLGFAVFLCTIAYAGQAIERDGLAGLLPCWVRPLLHMPVYELMRASANKAILVACDLMRVGMLVFVDLNEEQYREILNGLDPRLRRAMFERPSVRLLPGWVQRVILGRAWKTAGASEDPVDAAMSPEATPQGSRRAYQSPASSGKLIHRKNSMELMNVVRNMQGLTELSEARAAVFTMERVLAEKVVESAAKNAKEVADNAKMAAKDFAKGSYDYTKEKCTAACDGIKEAAGNRQNRIAAGTAVGGAAVLGAGGGATGLVSGGMIGAAVGIVPAIFTFGLSIPIGAAIGGGAGLAIGTAAGGSVGLVGGGVAGYKLSAPREARQPDTALEERSVQNGRSRALSGNADLKKAGDSSEAGFSISSGSSTRD